MIRHSSFGWNFSCMLLPLGCLFFSLSTFANAAPLKIPNRIFNIQSYGAKPDGKTDDTDAFRNAMQACEKAGGGTIEVPNGRYLTGPIDLQSHTNLHLSSGATILFTDREEAYPLPNGGYHPLLLARNGSAIAITGKGTMDGQGAPWWKAFLEAKKRGEIMRRPSMVVFDHCNHILVQGVTLLNSPNIHLNPEYCTDLRVDGVIIRAPMNSPNTDGIDPTHCKDVSITRCTIDTGDDCIAIGSGMDHSRKPFGPCKHIRISDCVFLHGHGLSIGSFTESGVRNVVVENCIFDGTDNGIRLKSERGRGGVVENLTYRNITMKNVKRVIDIMSYYPHSPKFGQLDPPQPVTASTPVWRDITIRNLHATNCQEVGIIVGLPEEPVAGLVLRHVFISAKKGLRISYAKHIRLIDTTILTAPNTKPIRMEAVTNFKQAGKLKS